MDDEITCRYKGHLHSHCDCPWWRRWWYKARPIRGPVSGTIVMPKVTLPEGYEPPSAAVPPPRTHRRAGRMSWTPLGYRWRVGTQVGRTLYIDTGEKDPDNLFGLVDDADIAAHIVALHNAWYDEHHDGRFVDRSDPETENK